MGGGRITTVTLNPAIDLTVTLSGVQLGEVNRAEKTKMNAGGKGVNVASLLADDGLKVAATGWLGNGNGAIFQRLFAEKSIEDAFLWLPGDTRTNVKLVDAASGQTTDLNGLGLSGDAAQTAELVNQIARLAADSDWVVLAGSLPPGAPEDIYGELVARAKAAGAKVALDTSGAPLSAGLEAAPDLVKPNEVELGELLGRELSAPEEVEAAAAALHARGIAEVAVSMGSQGALLSAEGERVWARPPKVEVASTVGAGDAFVSGLISGHARGLGLADRARRATAFAAHAVSIVGNDLASAARLSALIEGVNITRTAGQAAAGGDHG